jgi:hypothetical protein
MARLALLPTNKRPLPTCRRLPPVQIAPDGSLLFYYFGTSTTPLRRRITYRRARVWVEENSREKKNPPFLMGLSLSRICLDHRQSSLCHPRSLAGTG